MSGMHPWMEVSAQLTYFQHKEDKDHASHKKNGPYQQVFSRGNEIEIDNFIYLGNDIDASGSCISEIRRQMALAGAVMKRLCKSVFKRHDVSLFLKLRLVDTCNVCNDLQCTQSWTLTTEIETKIDACENDGSADCYELITNIGLPTEKLEEEQR